MGLYNSIKKLFHQNNDDISEIEEQEEVEIPLEKEIKNDKDDIEIIDEYLHNIKILISRLELINISHGENEYLMENIDIYKSKLDELNKKYNNFDYNDTSIANYNERINYSLELSLLYDELKEFSKPYLYLEDLNVIKNKEVDASNIEEIKKCLLELESILYNYKTSDNYLNNKIHEVLVTIIYELLKKESVCCIHKNLYDNLSKAVKLSIDEMFLKELISKAKENENIKEYIDKNNISLIGFDYDMAKKLFTEEEIEKLKKSKTSNSAVTKINDLKFDLIDSSLVTGPNQSKIFEEGLLASITDYAVIVGGNSKELSLGRIFGTWWFKDGNMVNTDKGIFPGNASLKTVGIRPVIKFSTIAQYVNVDVANLNSNIFEIKFGEYPQSMPEQKVINTEEEWWNMYINAPSTGKEYHFDAAVTWSDGNNKDFYSSCEYEMDNRKFVRIVTSREAQECPLSKRRYKLPNRVYWLEVEPVTWIVDLENDIAISKNILFAGIPFGDNIEDYDNSIIKEYLNTYFAKEILPTDIYLLYYGKDEKTNEKTNENIGENNKKTKKSNNKRKKLVVPL